MDEEDMPRRLDVNVRDLRLCLFEWGEARADEPCYLLLHATGFHARCWDQVVSAMGNVHVLAVDQRGHGRSDKQSPYNWDQFSEDLLAVIRTLDLSCLVACGHSMGGHAVLSAAAAEADRFHRLLLLDPVILPEAAYLQGRPDGVAADVTLASGHPVSRRYNQFSGSEEMAQRLGSKGGYRTWRPEVFADYCRHGLEENDEGGLQLACPPLVEAEIYMGSAGTSIHDLITGINLPVTVVRGRHGDRSGQVMDFAGSPTFPELAERLPQGRDIYRPDLSHFIPMQEPRWVADLLLGKEDRAA